MSDLVILAAEKKFWILDPLYGLLGQLLAFFYAVIPSYGVAIILLTVAVSLLRMPLVAKQVKSQQEMQRIQPELKRIQAKYKAEPQKRNEELMKLYKEHNVNPFAGCLPVLLQMPLFIVLYRLILNLSATPPKHIPTNSALYESLNEAGGKLQSFGMDLAKSASKVDGGLLDLFPYALLIALVVGTGIFQSRQMTRRLPKDAANSQMAVMGKIFPVFLGFISFSIPAGVVLYFIVSNLWQIGQQAVMFRHREGPAGTLDKASGSKAKPSASDRGKPSGGTKAPSAAAGDGPGGAGAAGTGGGLFARLAKALGTPAGTEATGSGAGGAGDGQGGTDGKVNGRGGSPKGATAKGGTAKGGTGKGAAAPGRGRSGKGGSGRGSSAGGKGGSSGGGGGGGGGASGRSNGRVTPRGGGRPQGKGQSGRSKPRNSRRGK